MLNRSIQRAHKAPWENLCIKATNPFVTIKKLAFQDNKNSLVDFISDRLPEFKISGP